MVQALAFLPAIIQEMNEHKVEKSSRMWYSSAWLKKGVNKLFENKISKNFSFSNISVEG